MRVHAFFLSWLLAVNAAAADSFDYFGANRQLIRNGLQAVLTCNGLFTSKRSLEQVFSQELAYIGDHRVGAASGGNYRIDHTLQLVSVGGGDDGPAVAAVFRQGIGCVVMAPDMTAADINQLPELPLRAPPWFRFLLWQSRPLVQARRRLELQKSDRPQTARYWRLAA